MDIKYNTDGLFPLADMRRSIIREIEEAEWMEEDSSTLNLELQLIQHRIMKGEVYDPNF